MATGYSGSYAVNGTRFLLQPTTAGWMDRDVLGLDGNGHPVYPAPREFEIKWGLAHPADVEQIINAYKSSGNTGTVSFDLPQWGASDYIFNTYSGCTMQEPTVGEYFNGYITNVSMRILLIQT